MRLPEADLAAFTREWALKLTEFGSVSGSAGEAALGPWLASELAADPAFGEAHCWSFPVAPGDNRHCVAMLVRGSGRETLILTGHFDTVTTADYGVLEPVATRPERLKEQLLERLRAQAQTAAEIRALADLESGLFLPGRGLLDMKAGLAAGLGACAAFAADPTRNGNLLFLAVPDEEVNSVGARAAAPMLPVIAAEADLDLVGAINLDAIADDHPEGVHGRIIALGTIGKVLPTAFVVGVHAHSGFPLAGFNAGAMAGAIAARVEWAPELTDQFSDGTSGAPPSLLSLRDGKTGYDVTTPATAFLTFNVLSAQRSPADVVDRFETLCRQAVDDLVQALVHRVAQSGDAAVLDHPVHLHRFETVVDAALNAAEGNAALLRARAEELAAGALPLPDQCRELTALAWALSGLVGPAVVVGFGSIPYLPTRLSSKPAAQKLRAAALALAESSQAEHGALLTATASFAGISDMSFLGEADEEALGVIAQNTPMWEAGVRWPEGNGIAKIPVVNLGPWGRDYHTPLERLHEPYAFDTLPRLLIDLSQRVLG